MDTDRVAERDRLERKLNAQWEWFDAHPDHPETEAKTEIFLRTLKRYEACCDAITRELVACP